MNPEPLITCLDVDYRGIKAVAASRAELQQEKAACERVKMREDAGLRFGQSAAAKCLEKARIQCRCRHANEIATQRRKRKGSSDE